VCLPLSACHMALCTGRAGAAAGLARRRSVRVPRACDFDKYLARTAYAYI
jgi:hypothetical protein